MRFEWNTTSILGIVVKRKPRRLSVSCTPSPANNGLWLVVAAESEDNVSPTAFLESHSHKLVNEKATSIVEAIKVAEDYATLWLAGISSEKDCSCEEIAPAAAWSHLDDEE